MSDTLARTRVPHRRPWLERLSGVMAVALVSVAGCGGSAPSASGTRHTQAALRSDTSTAAAIGAGFAQLVGATDIRCRNIGRSRDTHKPSYRCDWTVGATAFSGVWELDNGRPANLGPGASNHGPPGSDSAASQLATAATRNGGSQTCSKVLQINDPNGNPLYKPVNTYSCIVFQANGDIIPDSAGYPSRELWAWNPDGSVAAETIDHGDQTTEVLDVGGAALPPRTSSSASSSPAVATGGGSSPSRTQGHPTVGTYPNVPGGSSITSIRRARGGNESADTPSAGPAPSGFVPITVGPVDRAIGDVVSEPAGVPVATDVEHFIYGSCAIFCNVVHNGQLLQHENELGVSCSGQAPLIACDLSISIGAQTSPTSASVQMFGVFVDFRLLGRKVSGIYVQQWYVTPTGQLSLDALRTGPPTAHSGTQSPHTNPTEGTCSALILYGLTLSVSTHRTGCAVAKAVAVADLEQHGVDEQVNAGGLVQAFRVLGSWICRTTANQQVGCSDASSNAAVTVRVLNASPGRVGSTVNGSTLCVLAMGAVGVEESGTTCSAAAAAETSLNPHFSLHGWAKAGSWACLGLWVDYQVCTYRHANVSIVATFPPGYLGQ